MDPLKTGKIISDARRNKNLTQCALANKLHVSDKAISKWERGLCFPDISLLIPLTEILGINLYDLLKGETMNKKEEKDVEETLKSTISYSTNEIKKNKKKYLLVSIITIIMIVIASTLIIINNKKEDIGAIVDRDEIYQIDHFLNYQTTLDDKDGSKIEYIVSQLPLNWKERTFIIGKDSIKIKYDLTYKELVNAYKDEAYVKLAMINNAVVLFTMVDDLETFKMNFKDKHYTINKEELLKEFKIQDISKLKNKNTYLEKITKKLENKSFVEKVFEQTFQKN